MPDTAPAWRPTAVLVTCEHAGNEVPPEYAHLFQNPDARRDLDSHRGWDPGALGVALRLATRLSAPLLANRVTRLLVEANRSEDSPELFSRYSRPLPADERARVLACHYHPHRREAERLIASWIRCGERVLHLGIHSFTDVLDGRTQAVDLGLLFDPARPSEVSVCADWAVRLGGSGLRVRDNEPYAGADDGLTTFFRTVFPAEAYAGVEIEVRQGLLRTPEQERAVADLLADTAPCRTAARP